MSPAPERGNPNLRRIRRLAALGLTAPVLAAIPAAWAQDGLFGSRTHFTELSGEAIYHHVCAGCHMPDGRGAEGAGRYPSLAQAPRLEQPAFPIDMVLHGRGAMPPFQRLLTDPQIAAVVGYVRQNFGNVYGDPPTAEEVQAAREQR